MDFFNEFNNLQKEIFKNIFANSLKRPEQKPELKNPKSPKIPKLINTDAQNVKQQTRNFVNQQQKIANQKIKQEKFEFKKIQPQNCMPKNSGSKNLKKILPVQQNLQIQNLIIQNQFLYPEVPKSAGRTPKLNKNEATNLKNVQKTPKSATSPRKVPKNQIKPQSDSKKQKQDPEIQKQLKVKLPKRNSQGQKQSPKVIDENSNYKLILRKSEENSKANIYETPRKSFLVPQAKSDSNKGLRRGRSKYRTAVDLSIEVPEKHFEEMNKDEFFCVFGLMRKD